MLLNLLVIDIETVPQEESYSSLSSVWQSLWVDKISKIVPESLTPEESYLQRAGILAEFGKIVCIVVGYFVEDEQKNVCLRLKTISGHNEKEMLENFKELLIKILKRNPNIQFAGHNIKEFDIPYICRRMIINEIGLPDFLQLNDKKPWEVKMFDTLHWWKFGDHKNYITLNLLASVLKVPTSKTDMDGSMVQHVYYKENNLKRIADYCELDVIVTANIILRYLGLPILDEKNIFSSK